MRKVEVFFQWATQLIAWGAVGMFLAVIGYITVRAVEAFSPEWLVPGGMLWAPLIGTLMLVLLSVAIALPIGIAAGVYLGVYARGRVRTVLGFGVELLASIPSIVVGLLGFAVLLVLHRWWGDVQASLALAAGSLAVLILPYIITATELGIRETPRSFVTQAYAMGASTGQVVRHIWLPSARPHIVKGAMLALARAAEDTAVILLTGAVASYGVPRSPGEPFEALPFFIYTTTAEYGTSEELGAVFVAAAMLVGIAGVVVMRVKS